MIESLLIRNIALFEEAAIDFSAGLHVLTGETGAGKSLVVDAVNFLCGAKTDRDILRTGSDKAYVEGVFNITGNRRVSELLDEQGVEDDGGRVILSRELLSSGRSVCRIGGVNVSLAIFKELTSMLIDLHGQHEHQSLLQESKHMDFLDSFGGKQHTGLIQETGQSYDLLVEANKQYRQAKEEQEAAIDRIEVLQARIKELTAANLKTGEEEELQQSKNTLRQADQIIKALQRSISLISDSPEGDETALSLIKQAMKSLDQLSGIDTQFAQIVSRIQSLYYELEEFAYDLSALARNIDSDSAKLEEVEIRLDFLRKLGRKYGATVNEMMQTLGRTETELTKFETLDQDLKKLADKCESTRARYLEVAAKLSESRKELAANFESQMESLLSELNMAGTHFLVDIHSEPQKPRYSGIDQVTMLISPNMGEEMKPLSRIASGGELSRMMLAMKALAAEKNEVPSMVFDEIDTGVSGRTAMVIARKLWDIARYRQVICVTHLHQLAAMANVHYFVSKFEQDGRTKAKVMKLADSERTTEIAKMLGDLKTQGESSLQHADVLLRDAVRYRTEHPQIY